MKFFKPKQVILSSITIIYIYEKLLGIDESLGVFLLAILNMNRRSCYVIHKV